MNGDHDPVHHVHGICNEFIKAVQEFYHAYPLDESQRESVERNVQPYTRTIADAFYAGMIYSGDAKWITYLNSTAYSATRISMEISSYEVCDADVRAIRDRAVALAQQVIDFAEAETAALHRAQPR